MKTRQKKKTSEKNVVRNQSIRRRRRRKYNRFFFSIREARDFSHPRFLYTFNTVSHVVSIQRRAFFFKRLVKHKSYPHKRFVLYTYKIMYYICMYIRLTEHVVNGAFGYYKMCVFKSDRTPSIFKNDCIVVILYVL